MSNTRGGRKIKITVMEYAYPHSNSAKNNGTGAEFPIFVSEYKRPTRAIEDFVVAMFDRDLTDAQSIGKSIFKYWALDMNYTKKQRLQKSNNKV